MEFQLFEERLACKQPRQSPRLKTWDVSNLTALGLNKLGLRSHSITFKLCGLRHKPQSSFSPSLRTRNNPARLF